MPQYYCLTSKVTHALRVQALSTLSNIPAELVVQAQMQEQFYIKTTFQCNLWNKKYYNFSVTEAVLPTYHVPFIT